MKLGYVAAATSGGSVSRSTEYACEDLALADLAEGLGHPADAAALRQRSVGYRKLFDPATGFLWARNADGSFASKLHDDPTAFLEEFTEANAWQSLWLVQRDAEGIAGLLGGHDKAVEKLAQLFDLTKTEWDQLDTSDPLKSATQRPYFWAGNEGDIHVPYLFAAWGRPDLTQKWVAWVRENLFGPGAEGLLATTTEGRCPPGTSGALSASTRSPAAIVTSSALRSSPTRRSRSRVAPSPSTRTAPEWTASTCSRRS